MGILLPQNIQPRTVIQPVNGFPVNFAGLLEGVQDLLQPTKDEAVPVSAKDLGLLDEADAGSGGVDVLGRGNFEAAEEGVRSHGEASKGWVREG